MSGMVYLIQPEELIGTVEYKIGMSNSSSIRRVRSYGYGSDCIATWKCSNPLEVEKYLIQSFRNHFGEPTTGNEYFKGNETEMIKVFQDCIRDHAKYETPIYDDKMLIKGRAIILTAFIESHVNKVARLAQVKYLGSTNAISKELYDLLSLLPTDWFDNSCNRQFVTFGLLNDTSYDQSNVLNTLRKVLCERYSQYSETEFIILISSRLTTRQKQLTLCGLKKEIRKVNSAGFDFWFLKWNKSKSRKLIYRDGAIMMMKDAKMLLPSHKLTQDRLTKVDARIAIETVHICKSCLGRATIDCCSNSSRRNRTTRICIVNAAIV
jgi:hypothetical protein